MRCSCKECGTYMVQADSEKLGCVCPDCGYRCDDCLGTNTVVSREMLRTLAFDPRFQPDNIAANFAPRQVHGYASEDQTDPGERRHTEDELRGW